MMHESQCICVPSSDSRVWVCCAALCSPPLSLSMLSDSYREEGERLGVIIMPSPSHFSPFTHTCTRTHTYTYTYTSRQAHTHADTHTHTHTHARTHAHTHTHARTNTHTHTHACTHTQTHTHKHIGVQSYSSIRVRYMPTGFRSNLYTAFGQSD